MTKLMEKMTDNEIDNDERLQIGVTLERFSDHVLNPYEGKPDVYPDNDSLGSLRDAMIIQEWLDEELPRLVDAAREAGQSWEEIGGAMGISRQAAWERFR